LGVALVLKPKGLTGRTVVKRAPGFSKSAAVISKAKIQAPTDYPGAMVGPPVDVSVEGGWTPVWFHVAEGYDLEWGACFYQWAQDLERHGVAGDKVAEWMIKYMNVIMDWVINLSGLGFITNRVCFRVLMPALKVHVTGGLGPIELIGPAVPRGLSRTLPDGTVVPGTGPNETGGYTIEGWNPQNSRPGFNAKFGKWPMQWPPPEGKLGGAWLRNLGDLAGVGYPVYQMITAQGGEEKSWPMMTRAGWRAMFRLGADFVLLAVVEDGELSNRAAMDLFHKWRPQGSSGLQKGISSKKKAENRYK
jgi:hypothetical protein